MNKLVKQAFTLIELLVVIAIIGILSSLIVMAMSGVTQKANIAKAQVFSNSVRNSLMLNLVSEWKLDGNTNDSWSGGNNGTWYGSGGGTNTSVNYRPEAECVSGQCLNFDGTDDYVDCGNGSSLNFFANGAYTWSFWVKFIQIYSSPAGDRNRIFQKATTGKGYVLSVNDSAYFGISNPNGWVGVKTIAPLSSGIWYNLVMTYNNQNIAIYVNGISNNSGTAGTFVTDNESTPRIAGSTTSVCPNALIDDIRVYNAVMPTSQIKEQYYSGLNKLLAKGEITRADYQDRIGELMAQK